MIGPQELGPLPEAVERGDDGARKQVVQDLEKTKKLYYSSALFLLRRRGWLMASSSVLSFSEMAKPPSSFLLLLSPKTEWMKGHDDISPFLLDGQLS